ncbi:MAG: tetrahydrofolate dehydrogenase/cyclohydrolase catalytic domain-containing protein [Desulfotomaculaceae bacterium]|nr:tetrahydrofolate dehydrogenase/cyclohydrolase catalytic domain-containing protein [Desulfotomaculaceae bacterium]
MATIIEGKQIAASISKNVIEEVSLLKRKGIMPKLSVILVGNDPASVVYARSKEKACVKAGIDFEMYALAGDIPEDELLALIRRLNLNQNVHGIMIELPLPKRMNKQKAFEAIWPVKDVDGVHPVNRGHLFSSGDGLFPATPQSCIELLRQSGIGLAGKHAVLVGRGETVGKPLIFMLLSENATVTICHTGTKDLGLYTNQADVLIVAAGKAGLITADLVRPGAVIIDAGINEKPGGGICGDVDFDNVCMVAGAISPVPGGVGSLTTVMLQKNLLKAIRLQKSLHNGSL